MIVRQVVEWITDCTCQRSERWEDGQLVETRIMLCAAAQEACHRHFEDLEAERVAQLPLFST